MKTTMKFLTYILIASALIMTSCDGEDGTDGEDGEDGNAEVIYSEWIPADFTGNSSSLKFMGIDFPPQLPSAFSIKNT
ncbi:hypothetical protein [uncultured Aquimarina sp.]|uniref:hypothetical protein n=1 Tax=uncultured Aquimarina sp. TaxID=575652 RepID=UPI00262315DC|nr:hypothetical protein [uncultured Aquimarina sp.]